MYEIEIQPYIGDNNTYPPEKSFTFDGKVMMHFKCEKPTDKLVFHSEGLIFDTSSLFLSSSLPGEDITIDPNFSTDQVKQFIIFSFNKECTQNVNYTFGIKYQGPILVDKLFGLYLSSYFDSNNKLN